MNDATVRVQELRTHKSDRTPKGPKLMAIDVRDGVAHIRTSSNHSVQVRAAELFSAVDRVRLAALGVV